MVMPTSAPLALYHLRYRSSTGHLAARPRRSRRLDSSTALTPHLAIYGPHVQRLLRAEEERSAHPISQFPAGRPAFDASPNGTTFLTHPSTATRPREMPTCDPASVRHAPGLPSRKQT